MIGILFSNDRAMQLHAALRSFFRHCRDAAQIDLKVLYSTSGALHEQQYDDLRREFSSVEFLKEELFRNDVLTLLSRREKVLFLLDDDIFTREFRLSDAVDCLDRQTDAIGFSLRLGENTTECGQLDAPEAVPGFAGVSEGIVQFRWVDAPRDFATPLELSGSIYRTPDLLALLKQVGFRNPEELEAAMDAHKSLYAQYRPSLLCYEKSVVFRNPADKARTVSSNEPDGDDEAGRLAIMFRVGLRIAVESFDGFLPTGCVQQVPLDFRPTERNRPRVSVVVPCSCGTLPHLPETVSSVVNQGFQDFEIIVASEEDGDDVRAEVERLTTEHSRHSIHAVAGGGGRAGALNRGISESKGEYVLPLDAGDTIASDALESCVALLDTNPGIALAFTDALFSDGEQTWRENAGAFELRQLMQANGIFPCSLYRRFLWERAGGYRADAGDENWDFRLTCAELGFQGRRIPEPLYFHSVTGQGESATDRAHDAETKARIVLNHPGVFDNTARKQAELMLANSLDRWNEEERRELTRMLEATARAVGNQDLHAAASILAACVQGFPAYTGAYLALSDLLVGEEQFEAAAAILEAGVATVAEAPAVLKRLGTIRYSMGDTAAAEKAFVDARALSPRDPDILLSLANICNGLERFAESLEYLQEALKIVPRDVDVWIAAAIAADRVKDFEKAQTAFERAMALDPEHPFVKKLAQMSMDQTAGGTSVGGNLEQPR